MKIHLNHAASANLVLALSLNLSTAAAPETTLRPAPEPDFQIASGWWTDLWAFWTPVGWKDHLHRFNVLWNGTILAKPHMNRRSGGQGSPGVDYTFSSGASDRGLQLSLTPDYEEWVRRFKTDKLRQDDHQVRQGWNEDEAPVLWSEWSKNGWRIRSEVFAHIPGGGDVQTGNEPLFLWLRLRVLDVATAPAAEKNQDFDLILQSPHLSTDMAMWNNVRFAPKQAGYPKPLKPESGELDPAKGFRVLEADSKVRLALAPGGDSAPVLFFAAEDDQPWYRLRVKLPAKQGAHVDVLLPMLSAERQVFDAELALG